MTFKARLIVLNNKPDPILNCSGDSFTYIWLENVLGHQISKTKVLQDFSSGVEGTKSSRCWICILPLFCSIQHVLFVSHVPWRHCIPGLIWALWCSGQHNMEGGSKLPVGVNSCSSVSHHWHSWVRGSSLQHNVEPKYGSSLFFDSVLTKDLHHVHV